MNQILQEYPCVILQDGESLLRIMPVSQRAVRLTATGRKDFLPEGEWKDRTPAVIGKEPFSGYRLSRQGENLIMQTECFRICVDLSTGSIRYLDGSGALLVREPDRGGRRLEQIPASPGQAEGGEGKVLPCHARVEFVFGDEGIYGFGSHEEGYLNLRGKSRQLYPHNRKAGVPSFVSTKGYGFLFDCQSFLRFADDETGSFVWLDAVDELDYYFLAGPSCESVLQAYRSLTGSVPLFPRWLYGYGQSREYYRNAGEILDTAEEYRRRNIPLSFLVQDWQSWEEGLWGQKSFDPARYPDPAAMIRELHRMGTSFMISIWPHMYGEGKNRKEMEEKGFLLANEATYNAFSAEARRLYWKQAEEGLFRYGVDAWWCDCTEPFEPDWQGTECPEPEERVRINVETAKEYLDARDINGYSLSHSRGIYEGQRGTTEEKRVVNLTRSSWAGQHRYGTITWSGDISGTWDTLAAQVAEGMNFCASGEPYWTLDIGGFFSAPGDSWFRRGEYPEGCRDLGYRELYTRWLQFGTFLPMMRSHGTDTPREIWNFGEPGTMFYDAIARFIRLRMEMLPGIYSQAAAVSMEDDTFITPPGLAFPRDPACRDIRDEFLAGPSMLVCPVTKPMYYAAGSRPLCGVSRTRSVYLPSGTDWYDFWSGERFEGGQTITADAPISRIPVYVKAGSILVFAPPDSRPDREDWKELIIRVYPGGDAAYTLYEDEGDSYRYEKGAFGRTHIRWDDDERTLSIGKTEGNYAGMPENRTYRIQVGKERRKLQANLKKSCSISFPQRL